MTSTVPDVGILRGPRPTAHSAGVCTTEASEAFRLGEGLPFPIALCGSAGHRHASGDLCSGCHVQLVQVSGQGAPLGHRTQESLDGIEFPLPAIVVLPVALCIQGQLRQHIQRAVVEAVHTQDPQTGRRSESTGALCPETPWSIFRWPVAWSGRRSPG